MLYSSMAVMNSNLSNIHAVSGLARFSWRDAFGACESSIVVNFAFLIS